MHFAARPTGASHCCRPVHTAGLRVGTSRSPLCLYAPINRRADSYRRPPRLYAPPPPCRCISPPPSRFILPQSRPPYPVPQQRIPLPYLFRGKNHRSIFRFTARHAARHCIPPQRTPAPPFALRQESLRPILSNKNAAAKPAPPAAPANAAAPRAPFPSPLSRRNVQNRHVRADERFAAVPPVRLPYTRRRRTHT